jgi:hypothetical protein
MNSNLNSGSSSSIFSSHSSKYQGLIQQSFLKRFRNILIDVYEYLHCIGADLTFVHSVMSYWRIFQIVGVCFIIRSSAFWGDEQSNHLLTDIIGRCLHFIPLTYRKVSLFVFFIFFICLFGFFLIFLSVSAFIYSKRGQLHQSSSSFILVFVAVFGHLGTVTAGKMMAVGIVKMIDDGLDISLLVLLIVSLLLTIIYSYLMGTIFSVSVAMKTDSFATMLPILQFFLFSFPMIFTFYFHFVDYFGTLIFVLGLFIGILFYGLFIFISHRNGSTIKLFHLKIITTSSSSTIGLLVFYIICLLQGFRIKEIIFGMFACEMIVLWRIFTFMYNQKETKNLRILDSLSEGEEFLTYISNPQKFMSVCMTCFRCSHSFCLSNIFFKLVTNTWPYNRTIWILYVKFVAIYPEDSKRLLSIVSEMKSHHLKGFMSKLFKLMFTKFYGKGSQILNLPLKRKLDSIEKLVQFARQKITGCWNLILQEDTQELYSFLTIAYNSIQKCKAKYLHLLNEYPNNLFVIQSHANF